jgi:hypothetical protein
MPTEYIVGPNQSMVDVALNSCGTVEALMPICRANNVSPSSIPQVGSDLIIPDNARRDQEVLRYAAANDVVIGTANVESPLALRVLLAPSMKLRWNSAVAPHTLGYYDFSQRGEGDFIAYHDLQDEYLTPNTLNHELLGVYDPLAGFPYMHEFVTSFMPDLDIQYRLPVTPSVEEVLVWSDTLTTTFKDEDGNEAIWNPLMVLEPNIQRAAAYLIAVMDLEVVAADSGNMTLRVHRQMKSDTEGGGAEMSSMSWMGTTSGGAADPDHPSNPDYTLLTLGPGIYTLEVIGHYIRTADSVVLPNSKSQIVIEIH